MRSGTNVRRARPRQGKIEVAPLLAALSALMLAPSLFLGAGCVEQDDDKPSEEDMKQVRNSILTAAPAPKFAVNADLEGKVVYLGLDVSPAVAEPGKELKLTHYWKLILSPGDGWRAFTHIEGPKNQSFVNADHVPVGGKYPVSQWKAGEIIRDEHTITVPATWTHESLIVYTGLWRGPTRLAVKTGPNDGQNRIVAATIPVNHPAKVGSTRKRYIARRIDQPIKIDGKLDEPAWRDALSTGVFVNTMNGAAAEQKTEAKLLWDDKNLYFAFENADTDIWASLAKRDDKLWTQEVDELMIDADGDGKTYIELQIAPNGNVFDTYLPQYRKYEDSIDPSKKPYSWNSRMVAKVSVVGTLNKHDDKDTSWTVEASLPLADVKGMDLQAELPKLPPTVGNIWRINMFRMDMPQGKNQQAAGWSPPLVGDFHALDKFGELVFGDDKGNIAPPPPPPPPAAAAGVGGAPGAPEKPGKGDKAGRKHGKKSGKADKTEKTPK